MFEHPPFTTLFSFVYLALLKLAIHLNVHISRTRFEAKQDSLQKRGKSMSDIGQF